MKLTKNFTLAEMTKTGHSKWQDENSNPPADIIENLRLLCVYVLQPLRSALGVPIQVNSGYRCPGLNKTVGGAKTSQHQSGKSADIVLPGHANVVLFEKVQELNLPFDQMIGEFNYQWIHISYDEKRARGEVLLSVKENGKTIYKHSQDETKNQYIPRR